MLFIQLLTPFDNYCKLISMVFYTIVAQNQSSWMSISTSVIANERYNQSQRWFPLAKNTPTLRRGLLSARHGLLISLLDEASSFISEKRCNPKILISMIRTIFTYFFFFDIYSL